MKVRITQMKAPWPAGAVVDQIVHFEAGAIPAWALGKCTQAGEDSVADHTVAAPIAGVSDVAGNLESKLTQEEREQIGAELHRVRDQAFEAVRVLEAENAELREQLAAKDLQILELQTAPPAGETAPKVDRAALEAEAKDLGVEFSPNIGDKTLAERVAKKKAEAK